jgi:cupredoxin-like protein
MQPPPVQERPSSMPAAPVAGMQQVERTGMRHRYLTSVLVIILLVVALVSTAGWAITARRTAPATPVTAAVGQPHDHSTHSHGGTAQNSPPIAPRDGVVTMRVPRLSPTAVNFIWTPEHLLLAANQKVVVRVANGDYMQHNFTFEPAKVAKNLPVGATTDIRFTAPSKPGTYRFYCKYHLQMMEGAVTVR